MFHEDVSCRNPRIDLDETTINLRHTITLSFLVSQNGNFAKELRRNSLSYSDDLEFIEKMKKCSRIVCPF